MTATAFPDSANGGFVMVILDVPFGVGLPNGGFLGRDPKYGLAAIQPVLREGSRVFFRALPIKLGTSLEDLKTQNQEYDAPRQDHSYCLTSALADSSEIPTLKIFCGVDGGFAEAKYFSEIQVTFLEEDLDVIESQDYLISRVAAILNPFLDKYRLLAEDYRVGHIADDRNFYLAVCHTSPLTDDDADRNVEALLASLATGREFRNIIGQGASNVVRTNSLDFLAPRPPISGTVLETFIGLAQSDYRLPLSYDLILQSLRALQIDRDYKIAIVHAATAVEVHALDLLLGMLLIEGKTDQQAWSLLESSDYEGVTKRLKQLESRTLDFAQASGTPHSQFLGTTLHQTWKGVLAHKRNRAVHAGVNAFTWAEASEAVTIAKRTIVFLDERVPQLKTAFH